MSNLSSDIYNPCLTYLLPQSVADPLKMACGVIPTAGTVCVCNDSDLCNGGHSVGGGVGLVFTIILAFYHNIA